jgi:hypothetical protein
MTGGGTNTDSVAAELTTAPPIVYTLHVYAAPLSAPCATAVYVADVAPAMSTPLRRHWYITVPNGAVPAAVNENVSNTVTDADVGSVVIVGASTTVTVTESVPNDFTVMPKLFAMALNELPTVVSMPTRFVYDPDCHRWMYTVGENTPTSYDDVSVVVGDVRSDT